MTDTNAATTAAHSARMTASFSNSARSVNTRAELAPMASTSNTVNSNQPGRRRRRRGLALRVGSVMGRLYPPQVTQRVDLSGDSAGGRRGQLLRCAISVVGRLLWRLAAMLKPQCCSDQCESTRTGHDGPAGVLARDSQSRA